MGSQGNRNCRHVQGGYHQTIEQACQGSHQKRQGDHGGNRSPALGCRTDHVRTESDDGSDGDIDITAHDDENHRQGHDRLLRELEGGIHQVEPIQKVRGPERKEDEHACKDDAQQHFPLGEELDQPVLQRHFIDEAAFCHQVSLFVHMLTSPLCKQLLVLVLVR
ncbi:hypothetical protein SDC9_191885 [bioreactor metagenome]|uniref:Uncharacterized protein n=1 Tax=bioreactor metagenome TaxID=1076179 RepID=A0A645IA81_9ZZZZ